MQIGMVDIGKQKLYEIEQLGVQQIETLLDEVQLGQNLHYLELIHMIQE